MRVTPWKCLIKYMTVCTINLIIRYRNAPCYTLLQLLRKKNLLDKQLKYNKTKKKKTILSVEKFSTNSLLLMIAFQQTISTDSKQQPQCPCMSKGDGEQLMVSCVRITSQIIPLKDTQEFCLIISVFLDRSSIYNQRGPSRSSGTRRKSYILSLSRRW